MHSLHRLAAAALLLAAGSVHAQHATASGTSSSAAPAEARQFDFLVGQWELDVTPKVSSLAAMIHGTPKLVGTLKAWRGLDGFGVEDELRVSDASGNPMSMNHALRGWDRAKRQWNVVGLEVLRGHPSTSTAQWQDGEMRVSGSGTDAEGKAFASRTRYFDIGADHFRMQQDRSYDNGQTWEEATLTMDAKRVAATAAR